MQYDKAMLKSWAEMEMWDQHLERNGAFNDYVSKEGWQHIEQKYFREVKRRIESCKRLLTEHDDACIHYTLAQLYDRGDMNESTDLLFKRGVRFHCIRAVRKNPNYAPQWTLLAESYAWVASIGGDSKKVMPSMEVLCEKTITMDTGIDSRDPRVHRRVLWLINRAITCMKRAIDLEPENRRDNRKMREYCRGRDELIAESQKDGFRQRI